MVSSCRSFNRFSSLCHVVKLSTPLANSVQGDQIQKIFKDQEGLSQSNWENDVLRSSMSPLKQFWGGICLQVHRLNPKMMKQKYPIGSTQT
ncbi:hypothetical protein TNIN_34221 [Trichonephila inaurata madagascariensis]|uniref:Uncharacterized protein n=1 Tax=Trichonephila inaurata madagascariensis TaxID=2747483 RepID=A0A8X6YTW2_9ARAC|nr:hypothetical protein TNIN_34221 [Trichonephila inaurata madagascariensis]